MTSAIIGLISGIIGGLVYQILIWSFNDVLGTIDITPFQIGAYILIRPGLDFTPLTAQFLGTIQHFASSILLGLTAVYLLRFMGTDYLWLKGVMYGVVIYFLLYGVIAKALIPVAIYQPTLNTSLIFMFGNVAYSVVTVTVAGSYLKKRTPI